MKDTTKTLLKAAGITAGVIAACSIAAGTKEHIDNKKNNVQPKSTYEGGVKRGLDFACGSLALVVFWPLYLITAILVKTKLGSPVLFTQDRPGKIDPKTGKEKIFKLYKFRTMTDEKDENGELLPDEVRLTKFGKFLRSTSLDELPEAFNIIKGDMSVVGPRPLLVEYLPYYTEKERHRHDIRPGLSGLAQINGRNTGSWEEKFEYDLEYSKNISLINDLRIILKTVIKAARRSDIQVGSEIEAGRLDDYRRKER